MIKFFKYINYFKYLEKYLCLYLAKGNDESFGIYMCSRAPGFKWPEHGLLFWIGKQLFRRECTTQLVKSSKHIVNIIYILHVHLFSSLVRVLSPQNLFLIGLHWQGTVLSPCKNYLPSLKNSKIGKQSRLRKIDNWLPCLCNMRKSLSECGVVNEQ